MTTSVAWSTRESNGGNCSTEYVSTGGALRRAVASGGGVECASFVMLLVPKVAADAPEYRVTGPAVGVFEGHAIASTFLATLAASVPSYGHMARMMVRRVR